MRPLSSLWLAFAAPACEPGKDTLVIFCSASLPFSSGTAPDCVGTLARCHGSDLLTLRLRLAHKPAVPFLTSPAFWKDSGFCRSPVLPSPHAHFVPPFGVFRLADSIEPPESCRPCWRTVATIYPLGNCDSLRLETFLSYLTRIGTVSNRSFSLSS